MKGMRIAVAALALAGITAATAAAATSSDVATGLDDPRGITVGPGGQLVVAEVSRGVTGLKLKGKGTQEKELIAAPGVVDVAVDGGLGRTYVVTGGAPPDAEAAPGGSLPSASLIRLRPSGDFDVVADIAAYQEGDPDPDDLEEFPEESNPNGIALLDGNRALVTDAANNDLLLVDLGTGAITTVARFGTELSPWPADLPFGPPPGTPVPAESVPTSVAVGPDGAWYVTELKGFPFVEGTSRIWRIEPGAAGATCDPANDDAGPCTTVGTGYTSLIDLAFGSDGTMYPLEIVKGGLRSLEFGGAPPIGALYAVQGGTKTELVPGTLLAPGGVAAGDDGLYVTTGTLFGPDAGGVVRVAA
jgi:hypothetical protein